MSALAEVATTLTVVAATVALAAGILWLTLIRDSYVKVHAMAMSVVLGPSLMLLATLFVGDGGLVLRALLVIAFLIATAAVSAHAMVRLRSTRGDEAE